MLIIEIIWPSAKCFVYNDFDDAINLFLKQVCSCAVVDACLIYPYVEISLINRHTSKENNTNYRQMDISGMLNSSTNVYIITEICHPTALRQFRSLFCVLCPMPLVSLDCSF